MTESLRRAIAGIGLPLAAMVVAVAAAAAGAGSIPDPIATHWGLDGAPDDSMRVSAFYAMTFGLVVLTGAAAFVVSRRPRPVRGDLAGPIAIFTFLQWLFAGVTVATIVANLDAASWQDAKELPVPIALLLPLIAAGVAAVAVAVTLPIGEERAYDPRTRETVDRGPTERLVWVGHVRSRWPLAIGGLVAAIGLVAIVGIGFVPGLALILAGAGLGLFSSVEVTADRLGVTVRYGPFRWPRTFIDLDLIERADVIEVKPMSHGGWGYRGSMRVFGRAAVVLRAGPGIRLELRNGRTFVVTVDDASSGAGTVNDLIPTPVS